MKKRLLFLCVIVALLATLAPVSVFAAEPAEVKVFVHNNTGGEVELSLTDADGNIHWMTAVAGVSTHEMTEGKYQFYAVTPCGTQAGLWNLNVAKELFIECVPTGVALSLEKECPDNYFGMVWLDKNSGIHMYVEKDSLNLPDSEYFNSYIAWWFGPYPEWVQVGEMCYYDFTPDRHVHYWTDGVYYDHNEW